MTKLPLTAGAAAAALLAATTAFAEEEAVVNVYNWSDYIDEEILTEFEAETGIKVVYDVFDSNNILETKLLTGSTGYDVVVPSGTFLARQIQAGIFRQLDKSKLANIGNLDETIMTVVSQWDPGNSYAINYMWGTTGFGYNSEKIAERAPDAPTGSWGMLFDPDVVSKFADCGVYMMDEPDEVVPAVLNYIGEDPNSHDTDVIAKVEPKCCWRSGRTSAASTTRPRSTISPTATSASPWAGRATCCRPATAPGRQRTMSRSPM